MTAWDASPIDVDVDSERPVLALDEVVVEFPVDGGTVHAVSGVSLEVRRGETLGLVGESGCGKSTLGRTILGLHQPVSGTVTFDGQVITGMRPRELRRLRPRLQMVFQDPISSLNPRRSVSDIVREPLRVWGRDDPDRVAELMEAVGLDPEVVGDRRPRQFSGGQCQRVSIARALVLEPELLVCDEPVSALDVSVQAQILNLLEELKARYGLTMMFIAHDLAVVKNISDRVAVMYLGRICEVAPSDTLYRAPAHPYTLALLEAIPTPDPEVAPPPVTRAAGELPSPLDPPSGCRFRTRCPAADARCAAEVPELRPIGPDQLVACHHPVTGP